MKSFVVTAKVPEYEEGGFWYDHVELDVMVDDEDFERVKEFTWYARCHSGKRNRFVVLSTISKRKTFLHHFILGKPPAGFVTDHKDGNSCNNQKNNLRFVTNRQNSQNKHIEMSCPYPGVRYHSRDRRYRAKITISGKEKELGSFKSPEEAFVCYQYAVESIGETVLDY